MAVVVVGGQARKIGKTSLICGLIAALPERQWTAIKITDHAHGLTSGREFAITEERDPSAASDTARFLQAGASRALLVSSRQGHLTAALSELRRALAAAGNVILESNSVMRFLRPDVYLLVVDDRVADVKESARDFLELATAVVMVRGDSAKGEAFSPPWLAGKEVFGARPSKRVTPELVEFLRRRLRDEPLRWLG
ncbi:MAG TPA: hypothetical protein VGQ71_12795 [Terriglobales bacterium]|nr:hypothetical protein [Terriglobales bacterium]